MAKLLMLAAVLFIVPFALTRLKREASAIQRILDATVSY
jgi:hypothetical protein